MRRAIHLGDVAWEAAIVAALHRLSKTPFYAAGDKDRAADDFATAHDAFHQALVAACSSTWLLKMRALLTAQSERYRRLSVPLAKFERNAEQEHRDIAAAVLARDAKRAVRLMSEHFQRTTQIVLASGVADEFGEGEAGGERDILVKRANSRGR